MRLKSLEGWQARRDAKLFIMLNPEEPAWLLNEEVDEASETVLFEVAHRWPPQGWQKRRYNYDMISDVIHFRGAEPLGDGEVTRLKAAQRLVRPNVVG